MAFTPQSPDSTSEKAVNHSSPLIQAVLKTENNWVAEGISHLDLALFFLVSCKWDIFIARDDAKPPNLLCSLLIFNISVENAVNNTKNYFLLLYLRRLRWLKHPVYPLFCYYIHFFPLLFPCTPLTGSSLSPVLLEGFPLHCCQVLDHIVISPHFLSIEGPWRNCCWELAVYQYNSLQNL